MPDNQTHSQTELSNCTVIKTLLMLTIVFFHSSLFWGDSNWLSNLATPKRESSFIPLLTYVLSSFHTQTFALISGYLFYYLKFEKGKYARFFPFLLNKARRLIIPLIAVSLFWVIPVSLLIIPDFQNQIVDKFLLMKAPSQLWFLLVLFHCFVLFYFFSSFFARHTRLGFVILLTFPLIGFFAPSVFRISTFFTYAVIFGTGFKLRQLKLTIKRKRWIFTLFAVCLFLLWALRYITTFENPSVYTKCLKLLLATACDVVVPAAVFITLQKAAPWIPGKESAFFKLFSRHSMTIYLFHQQTIYYTILAFNGYLPIPIHIGVNFVVSTGVSLLLALVLTQFKIGRFIIGESK